MKADFFEPSAQLSLLKLELDQLISPQKSRERQLVMAMIVARIIDPRSKLATVRGLNPDTCVSTLGEILGVSYADEDQLYAAMDWLLQRQPEIENSLAKKHLREGTLILYDISSTYFEGTSCPLAQFGYNRDRKKGKLQIVFGLLCNPQGCPIAVEVFEGNTGDPTTLPKQIEKVRSRFGIERVVWVADRGMITQALLEEDFLFQGLEWITALRSNQIRVLVETDAIQLSLFDQQDLAEITSPDYPGERLIACRNPLLAQSRAQKREELLLATERLLDKITAATMRAKRPLRGADKIGLRVGKVLNQFGVGKHFCIQITQESFDYASKQESIQQESALDGLYVIRTTVEATRLNAPDTVRAYKSLSTVEQAFRSYKTIDLKVRPIFHHLADRVKAHIFLCMLAYYVIWYMRQALAPILFDDEEIECLQEKSPVATAQRSQSCLAKAHKKRTESGFTVHSFQTLLADLSTLTKNRIRSNLSGLNLCFDKFTQPTPLQQKALDLLGVGL